MYAEITVNALSPVAMTDVLGLEASTPEAIFTRLSASNGETVVIRCSGAVWDRLRPQLRKLSQRRIPALTAGGAIIPGRTAPAMTYTQEWIPGDRPRIHQVESSALVVGSDNTFVLRGENFIPGARSTLTLYRETVTSGGFAAAGTTPLYQSPEAVLRFTAVAKGPVGDKIAILIKAASGAGSVLTEELADGEIRVTIVPAAGSATATAIAAQVAGDSLAPLFVTASALVGAAVIPAFSGNGPISGPNVVNTLPFQYLTGGDGTGVAFADLLVAGVDPTNRLRIQAQRAGNQGNLINLTIRMSQGSNGVSVSGNSITVDRTASSVAIGTLASAINGNAAANALVQATAVGSGSLADVTQTYLAGGAGEQVSAQVGGASATVTLQTDTSMTLTVTSAALSAAGVAAGEVAQINLLIDYQRLSSVVVAEAAGP